MDARPETTLLQLRPREVLDIRDGRGLAVRCLGGALWITQANDSDDIVLKAGQCFVLDRPGLALVSAPAGPATVLIEAAALAGPCTRSARPLADELRPAA